MLYAAHRLMHSSREATGVASESFWPGAPVKDISQALRNCIFEDPKLVVYSVSLDDGQSRRMVEVGPAIVDVDSEAVVSEDVGVGVVERLAGAVDCAPDGAGDCDCDDAWDVLLDLFARAPPTPPPTAATMTMMATMRPIQNVLFLIPHIVRGWSCS